jgi:hypothetical protein
MPEKTKKQLERDKLSQEAAKELKKMKKKLADQGLSIKLKVGDLLRKMAPVPQQESSPTQKPFEKKKKRKLTEQQKKKVDKDAIIMEKQDIPGSPHFKMVPKKSGQGSNILRAAKGGSASKFPDLSGDGKVTKKDILMGRGVIKKRKGGSVTGRSIGPAGASIVSNDGKRIKQLKTIAKSVGVPGATAGLASGIGKLTKKLAGRLAKRGYGKARK